MARLADRDSNRIGRDRHRGIHNKTIRSDNLTIRIGIKRTCSGINGLAVRTRDLKPAAPAQSEIKLISRIRQGALNVKVSNRRCAHAEAELCIDDKLLTCLMTWRLAS